MYRLSVNTGSGTDFIEITAAVQEFVNSSGAKDGVCYIYVPHTTAGITINEHADPSVVEDIAEQLAALVPQRSGYHHAEGNSPAHIKAGLIGNSQYLFIEEEKLVLGTWQGIFFCEFDGPRKRTVLVKIMAD